MHVEEIFIWGKMKEKLAHFATQWLLLLFPQWQSKSKCRICISPLVAWTRLVIESGKA